MYSAIKFQIRKGDEFFDYCDQITKAANNLYNAALFRVRQVLTFTNKSQAQWTDNEWEVFRELEVALPLMNQVSKKQQYKMPTAGKTFLSYRFLDTLLRVTRNPDYTTKCISAHAAQATLKEVVASMTFFYAAIREHKKMPGKFTGKPKLPGYGKPGSNRTAEISNQECVLYAKDGGLEIKLPLIHKRYNIANAPVSGKLKMASIVPTHGIFLLVLIMDDGKETPATKTPNRICAIDMGVNNLAAITNNIGESCLLFKGGVAKSINQEYNKRMAKIMSEQTSGTTKKFVMTPESHALCQKRNAIISDLMHKNAKAIVEWCKANDIDTIVIGKTKSWKQESNIGAKNNQTFVQLPFDILRQYIAYRAERYGINVIEQEESYTSKASFVARDFIPVYGKNDSEAKFSGKRIQRGIYRNEDNTEINADLNGSANILRKAFPEAFDGKPVPDFQNAIVIKHPDLEKATALHQRQLKNKKPISKAKLCRQARKQKSNPSGIVAL